MVLAVMGMGIGRVVRVGRIVAVRLSRVTVAVAVRSGVGGAVVTVMGQTTHCHGGESYTTKCEAGQVEVHQLATGVFIGC